LISFLLGCLLLLVLTAFCAVCLRRFAGETDRVLLGLASLGLSGVWLVLGGALLLPWLSPQATLGVLGALSLGATLGLAYKPGWKPLVARPDALWLTLAGLPGALLAGFFALFIMSVSLAVDDGFFVHTSNMGMILAGKYPPTSFLGEPWQGHYGKDMLTSLLALMFGVHFLEVEWVSTVAIQMLHFLFLLHWLRLEGGRPLHGLLGAHFAFFASALGSHLGLVDTIANNNAVAYWTITLCSYLLLRWRRDGNLGAAVLGGVVLGADALIYELHFGLLGLALFSFTLPRKDRYKGFLLVVTTAVFLASVEGGAITHLARKALLGRAEHQQNVKKAWQSQDVAIKVPKDQPFYLRRDNLRPSRFFETRLRPAGASFEASRELAPVWSPSILASFWYPVWLAPLVLLVLGLQRNLLGGWFFALGAYSVLTPCLVSFGYFEGETARWLFGAAFGFSTAFALALAQACQSPGRGRYLAYLVLGWALWFNIPGVPLEVREMREALAHPGNPLRDGSPGIVPQGGLLPNPRLSLAHHYGFEDRHWALTEELRKRGEEAGDFLQARFLVNYPDEFTAQGVEVASGGMLNIMGLQTGLSGRLPAGVAGAPENRWCAPLFSQKLEARAFWADPQGWRLQQLGVRWLLVDETLLSAPVLAALQAVPGVTLLFRQGDSSLWQFQPPGEPAVEAVEAVTLDSLTLDSRWQAAEELAARRPFALSLRAVAPRSGQAQLQFRYLEADSLEPANPDDLLPARQSVAPGEDSLTVTLVGPYFAGKYRLQWRQNGSVDWSDLTELEFREPLP
jgi:hypothetical protein